MTCEGTTEKRFQDFILFYLFWSVLPSVSDSSQGQLKLSLRKTGTWYTIILEVSLVPEVSLRAAGPPLRPSPLCVSTVPGARSVSTWRDTACSMCARGEAG
jgi:hypothetical protein